MQIAEIHSSGGGGFTFGCLVWILLIVFVFKEKVFQPICILSDSFPSTVMDRGGWPFFGPIAKIGVSQIHHRVLGWLCYILPLLGDRPNFGDIYTAHKV